jgi:hypothetical protein
MLEEHPKKFTSTKPYLSTFYNNNIAKHKENFNPYNTNYSPKKKRVTFSFDTLNDNSLKKESLINDNTSHRIIYNKKCSNKNKQDIVNNSKNNYNLTQSNNNINNNKIKFNSFDSKNSKILKTFSNLKIKQNRNENESGNLFSNLNKNKKLIKNIRSVNNLNKNRLMALYGYDKDFIRSKRNLLKSKDIINLEHYQNDILKVSLRNLSKDHMIKLFTELQSIKRAADMVKPLPPINYPALILHSFKELENKRRNIFKISFEDKKLEDMDDYEKEIYQIKKSNLFKREKVVRNKRIYKIYEILPEHVIDTVYRKRNKVIK